ncbi:ROK family glucokinase [Bacillus horti]|uniref:Glucokinase n=1 Tax=Caldalkalibacillus horti TaxID=77523 RepID=A0ABT9W3H1_9BACI|nr:ROK family glucokinase [Bacillus horti]MDQ0167799.1 glucokinase [Bacillus horti]
MSQTMYVGIDLGGTAIKLAFVSLEGEIVHLMSAPTNVEDGGDGILHTMDRLISEGLEELGRAKGDIKGVGIGAPGFIEMSTGFVHEAVNLGWKNYPLKEKLEGMTGLPVYVDNDANIAALGEMWKGAGEGAKDLLCITLGTGVGGGVIINGTIHHGAKGTAGEIGHTTVIADGGYRCNCGKLGCLETLASATGIVRLAKEALISDSQHTSSLAKVLKENGNVEAKDVLDAAREGDQLGKEILGQVAHYLGVTLGNYAVLMNPEKIVIGGGVSKAGDVLFEPIRAQYQKYALPHLTGNVEIAPATLGNDAGVIGAAWLVHQGEQNH